MNKHLNEIFDEQLSHLRFNKALATEFYKFRIDFINKNEEHMKFFGGNLTGVEVVRFTPRDTNVFFNEILKADIDDLADGILLCKEINQDFTVSSDTFNLTCMYLIHKFLTSSYLSESDKHKAAIDVALIYNYRILTSLLSHYFKYPADEAKAKATYANLSFKFLLKQLGSWNEVLLFRAKDLVSKESIHYSRLVKFNDDSLIVYAISDTQGRIRDILKNIYKEFMKVHDSNERISTSSSVQINTDGVEVIKDKVHGLENYTNYILNVTHERFSFIKKELVDIVLNLMQTTQENNFNKTLEFVTANIGNKKFPEIEEMIKTVIIHSFDYLNHHSTTLHNTKDLPGFLSRIKGIYLSSKSSDENLLKLRELGHLIVKEATQSSNENSISSIRTSLMLYICLRTYTKNYYTH